MKKSAWKWMRKQASFSTATWSGECEKHYRNVLRRWSRFSTRLQHRGGKSVQRLIVPLLSMRIINKPRHSLWKSFWKHVRSVIVMRSWLRALLEQFVIKYSTNWLIHDVKFIAKGRALVTFKFVNNFFAWCEFMQARCSFNQFTQTLN